LQFFIHCFIVSLSHCFDIPKEGLVAQQWSNVAMKQWNK